MENNRRDIGKIMQLPQISLKNVKIIWIYFAEISIDYFCIIFYNGIKTKIKKVKA